MTQINSFLIGAQKAGTTSLYDWLGQHSAINAPKEIKDYHFFYYEDEYQKGCNTLHKFFKENSPVQIHSGVNYIYYHDSVASRLYSYNPSAKIIICLREPVARAISAYKYFVRTLREDNCFEKAISKELNGELKSSNEKSNNTYISHGMYCEQIETYLNYFPEEQLHFVFFEELTNPIKQKSVLTDVCLFLNVDPSFEFNFTHLNASGVPKSQILNWIKRKSGITKIFKWFLPFGLRKKMGKKIEEMNISSIKMNVEIKKETLSQLNLIYKEERQNLSYLVKRDINLIWD